MSDEEKINELLELLREASKCLADCDMDSPQLEYATMMHNRIIRTMARYDAERSEGEVN